MADATGPAARLHGRILVVDDQDTNRQLLRDLLEFDGHEVVEARDGEQALALAADGDPDVILLDVTMPGMDGFEVCRRLRARPATSATPILLVTALGEREHRLQGMSSGANDYLVKPIDRSEVSLRVRNAVSMRGLHRAIEQQYQALQRVERLRDELVAMLAHDFRSPLTSVRGFLELVRDDLRDRLTPDLAEYLAGAVRSVDQLNGMIGDMLDVSRLEADALPLQRQPTDLRDATQNAVDALGPQPSFHRVPIGVVGNRCVVDCDAMLLHRVLVNLLANAVRFSPAGSPVEVCIEPGDGGGMVRVLDNGPGIAETDQQAIFDKFRQAEFAKASRGRSSGLGLTFCRMVVTAHGGRIGVRNRPTAGSEFWFWLPA